MVTALASAHKRTVGFATRRANKSWNPLMKFT